MGAFALRETARSAALHTALRSIYVLARLLRPGHLHVVMAESAVFPLPLLRIIFRRLTLPALIPIAAVLVAGECHDEEGDRT